MKTDLVTWRTWASNYREEQTWSAMQRIPPFTIILSISIQNSWKKFARNSPLPLEFLFCVDICSINVNRWVGLRRPKKCPPKRIHLDAKLFQLPIVLASPQCRDGRQNHNQLIRLNLQIVLRSFFYNWARTHRYM